MPILKTISYQLMKQYGKKFSKIRPVIIALLLLSPFASQTQSQTQQQPSREYQVKAVFLFNFAQFVDWPPASFAGEQAPLVIGILGTNPFGPYLEETVSGEKISGHPVTVQYFQDEADAKACHILFINLPEMRKRKHAIESLKGNNILTVCEAADFPRQGGMIRLFTRNNKIKLLINLEASRAADLVLSSKLLRLADIYKPTETNE